MTCEEARKHLWHKPFEPVRIRLKDGQAFEVHHRTLTLAAEAVLIIGIPPADEPDAAFSDRRLWVSWSDVDAIEPLTRGSAQAV